MGRAGPKSDFLAIFDVTLVMVTGVEQTARMLLYATNWEPRKQDTGKQARLVFTGGAGVDRVAECRVALRLT